MPCAAPCCPVLPRAGLHVLSSVSICVSIRMHMSIYICISQCVQVPTGSRAGGDERGLQLMVTLQGCAEAMKGEGFDSCNQPCFAKIFCLRRKAAGFYKPPAARFRPACRVRPAQGCWNTVPGARKRVDFVCARHPDSKKNYTRRTSSRLLQAAGRWQVAGPSTGLGLAG